MFIGPNKKLWTLNTMEQRNNKKNLSFIEEDLILLVIVESQLLLSWCMTLIFHQSTNSASETNHRRREDEEQTINSHLPSINQEKTKRWRRTNHDFRSSIDRPRQDEEQTIVILWDVEEPKRDDGDNKRKNRERNKRKGKKTRFVLPTFLHVSPSFIKKPIHKPHIKRDGITHFNLVYI